MGYPICIVEIYGRDESWEFAVQDTGHGVAPSGNLLSVRTDKRLGADTPAGVFDLRLTDARDATGRTWQDRLRPQDVVVIQMMNYQGRTGPNGEGEMHTAMIGFVDTITAMADITAQGIPQRQIQVRGRDAGKLFIAGMVTGFARFGASLLGKAEFAPLEYFNAKPDVLIQRLLKAVYEKILRIQVMANGTKTDFWDLLGYRLETFGGEFPGGLDAQFIMGEGTFWSHFTKVASPPFHELFVDTRRVQGAFEGTEITAETAVRTLGEDASAPVLFLRPAPFAYLKPDGKTSVLQPWEDLTVHTVGDDDLAGEPFSEMLSVSDVEQWNVYLVFGQYSGLDQQQFLQVAKPIVDREKFTRYGYKPMLPTTTLVRPEQHQGPWLDFYDRLAWRLASWHCLNDRFLSGTKTFKLLPHVHIGERLSDVSGGHEPRQFYIESVSHHFIQHERATTTLGLTRGLSVEDYRRYHSLLTGIGLTTPQHASEITDLYRSLISPGQQPPQ